MIECRHCGMVEQKDLVMAYYNGDYYCLPCLVKHYPGIREALWLLAESQYNH